MLDYRTALCALTFVLADPFICIALALSLSIGLHKAITNVASVASFGISAEKTSNYRIAWVLYTFSSLSMIIVFAFGASIINIATDTFLEIIATKSAAFFLQIVRVSTFGTFCFTCALQTVY